MDRFRLVNAEPGSVAIPEPFQTGGVVPLVFGVGQGLPLGWGQSGVVTGFQAILASREIALVRRGVCLFRLQRSEPGVVALIPTVGAILRVVPEFRGGRIPGLGRG